MSDYRYEAVKAKVRKGGWDSLTRDDKFDWHADVYARRRVRLGVSPDVRTSPADPEGDWYDAGRIAYAEGCYRRQDERHGEAVRAARRDNERRLQRVADLSPAEVQIEALAIKDQWARDHGYLDCADYQEREGLDYEDACSNIARSIVAAGSNERKGAFEDPLDADPHALLRALGVTAREERVCTAEDLRQGRIALGLEPPDEPDAPAAQAAE